MKTKITSLMFLTLALAIVTYYGCKKESSTKTATTTPTVSCSDGIQNQGETGVDCGGPCASCPCTPANYFCPTFPDCATGPYCGQQTSPTNVNFQGNVTFNGSEFTFTNFSNFGVSLGAAYGGSGNTLTIYNQAPWGSPFDGAVGGAGVNSGTIDTSGSKIVITLNYTISGGTHAGTYVAKYTKK